MELHIFQSEKGDCLLLEGQQGGKILCDGGMARSMRNHVRRHLRALSNGRLDAIYVSHIDQDHISGVLRLLEDALEWRVFDHHSAQGDDEVQQPDVPRPPEIHGIWHNAFRDLITRNRGRIENLLAASAPLFFGTGDPHAMKLAADMDNIASSIPEALKVSRLVRTDLLDIPLNRPPGRPDPGQLLLIEDPNPPFDIGSLRFHLVGPSKKQLRKLRTGWDEWLRDEGNRRRTRTIRDEMERRAGDLASGASADLPFDLRDWNGVPDFRGVTTPNTASLMFLVEEGEHTLLLTGDSQQDVILEGLEDTGHLDPGHLHVSVLKVPHHGSEHNADRNFCRRVTADHYVFCGNGENGNPEREVLQLYFDSRMGSANQLGMTPEAQDPNRPFTFWFSTTADQQRQGSSARRSFEETERVIGGMVAAANGRLRANFNARDFLTLRL